MPSTSAAGKLEKQVLKARTKWRDTKRTPRKASSEVESEPVAPVDAQPDGAPSGRVYHVNHHRKRKPMTLDEALMEMDATRDYLVYRDAETDRLQVLVRRRDGNFDLVESE